MSVSLGVSEEALNKVRDGLTFFFTARKIVDVIAGGPKKCSSSTVDG